MCLGSHGFWELPSVCAVGASIAAELSGNLGMDDAPFDVLKSGVLVSSRCVDPRKKYLQKQIQCKRCHFLQRTVWRILWDMMGRPEGRRVIEAK